MELVIAASLAFVAGVVFGVFGAGGSILLVPILVYVLHLPVKVSLGTALLILSMTGGVAALAHARSGNINWRVGFLWSAYGVGGAYLGGRVAEFIHPGALLGMFALVILISATGMLRSNNVGEKRTQPAGHAKSFFIGFGLGFLTGMIGVGGGFLLVPALVLLCGVTMKEAIGTSLLVIAIRSFGGFLGFAAHTTFPWAMVGTVALLNALGSIVGERVAKPLPAHKLRPAFAVFLLVVGVAMIVQNLVELLAGRTG